MNSEFEQAWAVMCRDTGVLDGNQLNVVEVLSVHWSEEAALGEVQLKRVEDPDRDHFYYYAETKVARRAPNAAMFTKELRNCTAANFSGIRRCLTEAGLDPDELALADLFEDDERCLFGVVVAPDGRAFTFRYLWNEDELETGRFANLSDISATSEDTPYWLEVRHGRRLLGLPTPSL
jgi:hypothetical protein